MRLTKHFLLSELTKSQTALRLGINNKPDNEAILNLIRISEKILEPIREQFGPFSPSSGFRCLELNRALRSKDTSQHVKGQAVDIEIPGVSNFELATWIKDNLTFDQLILECYTQGDPSSGWVHVSFAEKNRNEVLTYSNGSFQRGLVK